MQKSGGCSDDRLGPNTNTWSFQSFSSRERAYGRTERKGEKMNRKSAVVMFEKNKFEPDVVRKR